jgi:hypothetical protein
MYKKRKIFDISLIVLVAALYRISPHIPNVAPITGLALYSGVYLEHKYAILLPLAVMLVSDFFIGFHPGMPYVYGAFLLSSLIGIWLKNHLSVVSVAAGTLLASLLFFLITNFGVWIGSGMYKKNIEGLRDCFILALPFFRNTIMGDLLYTSLFFILHAVLESLNKKKAYETVQGK